MATRIALLRGVNLGAARRVAMVDIRRAAEEAGFGDVRSVLQSGNLVLRAPAGEEETVERKLEAAFLAALGLRTEVVARSAEAWRAMIVANPFPEEAARDPGRLVVVVLKTAPGPGAEAAIDAIDGRERARVIGREAFIYYPEGQADTKVAGARLDAALGVRGTGRNWNTVLKLAALADASWDATPRHSPP